MINAKKKTGEGKGIGRLGAGKQLGYNFQWRQISSSNVPSIYAFVHLSQEDDKFQGNGTFIINVSCCLLWGIWNSEWELSFLARKILDNNFRSSTNLFWEQIGYFLSLKPYLFLYKVKHSTLYDY